MSTIDKINAPIKKEMQEFEPFFRSTLKSKVTLLDLITNYVIRRKGKQIRPIFVFLSAKLNGEINHSTFVAATMIELVHTATLIHDDIVDEAYERRSVFSINALWKNKISVLIGDYFLSKGLLLATNEKEYGLLEIMAEAVREMSEGELIQIEKSRNLKITEDIYFDIIRKKTAALISSCTASGAKSVNVSPELLSKMKLFGEYAGIAFQIKDDLFDYQKKNLIGKPIANDIKEKKLTLPLIYSLSKSSTSEQKRILHIIKNHNKDAKKVAEVIDFVFEKGGMDYTVKIMNLYKDKALDILAEFPENEAKQSLAILVNYIVERDK